MQFLPAIAQTGSTRPAPSAPAPARDHVEGKFGQEMRAAESSRDRASDPQRREADAPIDRRTMQKPDSDRGQLDQATNHSSDMRPDAARDHGSERINDGSTPSVTGADSSAADAAEKVEPETVAMLPKEAHATAPPMPTAAPIQVTISPSALIEAQASAPAQPVADIEPILEQALPLKKAGAYPSPAIEPAKGLVAATPAAQSDLTANEGNAPPAPIVRTPAIAPQATPTPAAELPIVPTGAVAAAPVELGAANNSAAVNDIAVPNRPTTGVAGQPIVSPVPLSGAPSADGVSKKLVPAKSADHTASDAAKSDGDLTPGTVRSERPAARPVPVARFDLSDAPIKAMPEGKTTVTPTPLATGLSAPIGDGVSLPQISFTPSTAFPVSPVVAGQVNSTATPTSTAQISQAAPTVIHQVAVQITRGVQDSVDRISVQLKPAALGNVSIDLELGHDNRIIAVIAADRADTLDLLQRDAKALERALNEAGIKADSGSLSFNLRGENAARDFDGQDRNTGIALNGEAIGRDIAPDGIDPYPAQLSATAGGVDIRI